MKLLHLLVLMMAMLPLPARATYYAVAFSKDFLVVAIDSRTVDLLDPSQPPNDRYCKIHPLSDQTVFFSTGIVAMKDRLASFDANALAEKVYADVVHAPDFAALAENWSALMEAAYGKFLAAHPALAQSLDDKVMIKGYFAGIDDYAKVVLESAEISRRSGEFSTSFSHRQQSGDAIPIVHGGHSEIIDEFADGGTTARAKKVLAQIDAEGARESSADKMALLVEAFVRAVRDWSGDDTVGGDVAVLILERGKYPRWFRRPSFC